MNFADPPLPQSCKVCRFDEEAREEWACDGPRDPVTIEAEFDCFRCEGRDPECEVCEGTGKWAIHECPRRYVTAMAHRVCEVASLLETGAAIAEGGFTALPNPVVEGMAIVNSERARYERERIERIRRKGK